MTYSASQTRCNLVLRVRSPSAYVGNPRKTLPFWDGFAGSIYSDFWDGLLNIGFTAIHKFYSSDFLRLVWPISVLVSPGPQGWLADGRAWDEAKWEGRPRQRKAAWGCKVRRQHSCKKWTLGSDQIMGRMWHCQWLAENDEASTQRHIWRNWARAVRSFLKLGEWDWTHACLQIYFPLRGRPPWWVMIIAPLILVILRFCHSCVLGNFHLFPQKAPLLSPAPHPLLTMPCLTVLPPKDLFVIPFGSIW